MGIRAHDFDRDHQDQRDWRSSPRGQSGTVHFQEDSVRDLEDRPVQLFRHQPASEAMSCLMAGLTKQSPGKNTMKACSSIAAAAVTFLLFSIGLACSVDDKGKDGGPSGAFSYSRDARVAA